MGVLHDIANLFNDAAETEGIPATTWHGWALGGRGKGVLLINTNFIKCRRPEQVVVTEENDHCTQAGRTLTRPGKAAQRVEVRRRYIPGTSWYILVHHAAENSHSTVIGGRKINLIWSPPDTSAAY